MKRIFRIFLGLVYFAVLFVNLLFLVKSGSAIFYAKFPVDNQRIFRQDNAFRVSVKIDTRFFDPSSILYLENGAILEPILEKYQLSQMSGAYVAQVTAENEITFYFIPLADEVSNPQYFVYIRPYLFSTQKAGLISLGLMIGLTAFIYISLSNPEKRKVLLGSPLGFVRVWLGLYNHSKSHETVAARTISTWQQTAIIVILMTYLYVLMEWIFYTTKSSFMDLLSFPEKVKILLITALAGTAMALVVLFILFILNLLLGRLMPWFNHSIRHLPAAFLATCLTLIMVDNFTYTVLNFGVVNAKGPVRVLYGLLFTCCFYAMIRKFATVKTSKPINWFTVALLAFSMILAIFVYEPQSVTDTQVGSSRAKSLPNIIFLCPDGVNAENMAVYGYERETTPFINELAKTSLVSLNNFTNSGKTMGSETAVLTGKLSFETNIYFPPDTLKGIDKYQHLPMLLKQNGYHTVEVGVPYYVDANTIDFQNAFDIVNGVVNTTGFLRKLRGYGLDEEVYFLDSLLGRISDRFSHIFFIKDMVNPFDLLNDKNSPYRSDKDRIAVLKTYLDQVKETGQPLFAHIHLMDTHGYKVKTGVSFFSKGETQTTDWATDFYDDAILTYDSQVKDIVQYLQDNDLYDNTLLVLYSDHGQKWSTINRIPLIIHFPGGENSGTISQATQNIDIAPTVLEYLGISKPDWMSGSSLLGDLDPTRLIVSSNRSNFDESKATTEELLTTSIAQFNQVTVVQCQNWYNYDLLNKVVTSGEVIGYVDPCPTDQLDSPETVKKQVDELLRGFGYDLLDNW